MWRALWQRTLAGAAVVLGVVTLTFLLLHLAPGDPATRLLGPRATADAVTAERHALELDRPLGTQYAHWLAQFVVGHWGTSIATGRPVRDILARAWPATVRLVGLSLLLSYLAGLLIGVVQAARHGSWIDTGLSLASVTLAALPGYWLGLMLVLGFSYHARALPAFGAAGLDWDLLRGWPRAVDELRHLVLPLVTLTLVGAGGAARYARGALLDVAAQPFVLTARAKGLGPARVWWRHALPNALGPVLTMLGLSLPALFSGAVFVEAVFAWPGVGGVLVTAVESRDYPVVMAATAVSAVLVVTGNWLADVAAAWADPRLREASPA
ncbi:MAG TPA: ABC transporter permease [Gemmatimonadales bacterium]|nr:ABC transporter permease [Gemmatimonadales bacterium]